MPSFVRATSPAPRRRMLDSDTSDDPRNPRVLVGRVPDFALRTRACACGIAAIAAFRPKRDETDKTDRPPSPRVRAR